jgi:hypothetical protein
MKKPCLPAPLLAAAALALAACTPPFTNAPTEHSQTAPASRSFYASDLVNKSFYRLDAEKLAEGERCIVYAETGSGITLDQGETLALEYDERMYKRIASAFGLPEDVDGNGKVILLLLDIRDGYTQNKRSYTAGFFHSYHMFKKDDRHRYSNEADMLFIDINPHEFGSDSFYSTIVHELQHLINFSRTSFHGGSLEDTWIDEGLSTSAEYLYKEAHRELRIDFFNEDPYQSIRQGNTFFVWNGVWESEKAGAYYDQVANYATAYLFFQWLRIHAVNKARIYQDIINSKHRDYRAVVEAAQNRIDPSLDSWETLLRTWMLANARNEPTGLYGYRSELRTQVHPIRNASKTLAPGEGVFTGPAASGQAAVPEREGAEHIRYAAFQGPGPEDEPDRRDYLLMFNANSDNEGPSETGALASGSWASAVQPLLENAQPAPARPVRAPYPIDVLFDPDGSIRGRQ